MGGYVAEQVIKLMMKRRIQVSGSRALILGLAFKENCPDLRNTRVIDIIDELKTYGMQVDVWDPWVSPAEAEHEYGIKPIQAPETGVYDTMIVTVGHHQFADMGVEKIRAFGKSDAILYDVKYLFPTSATDGRL